MEAAIDYSTVHLPQQMPSLRVPVHNFLSIGIACRCLGLHLYNSYDHNKNTSQLYTHLGVYLYGSWLALCERYFVFKVAQKC